MLKILAYVMKVHRDVLERFFQRHFGVFFLRLERGTLIRHDEATLSTSKKSDFLLFCFVLES